MLTAINLLLLVLYSWQYLRACRLDAPQDPNVCVHRIGRTARMGKEGSALLFLSRSESSYIGMYCTSALSQSHSISCNEKNCLTLALVCCRATGWS